MAEGLMGQTSLLEWLIYFYFPNLTLTLPKFNRIMNSITHKAHPPIELQCFLLFPIRLLLTLTFFLSFQIHNK